MTFFSHACLNIEIQKQICLFCIENISYKKTHFVIPGLLIYSQTCPVPLQLEEIHQTISGEAVVEELVIEFGDRETPSLCPLLNFVSQKV